MQNTTTTTTPQLISTFYICDPAIIDAPTAEYLALSKSTAFEAYTLME